MDAQQADTLGKNVPGREAFLNEVLKVCVVTLVNTMCPEPQAVCSFSIAAVTDVYKLSDLK